MTKKPDEVTQILTEMSGAGAPEIAARLLPLVYDELHALAGKYLRGERKDHTLQPTALVHEAFMRLVDQSRVDWKGRTHFYAVGAEAMRRILIDHARAKGRAKRGGGWQRVVIEDPAMPGGTTEINLIDFREALERLGKLDPDQARVVELRVFAGLKVAEVAEIMGVSKRKVEGDWTHAKAWLRSELDPENPPR